ncbi:hypothetical protein [Haloferax sp. DFSO60]|uniref:hypothetical protein n=1 Tax=Haloferax sp. DFSO60 TaxID=3388652 RepID=UPI00397D74BC
MAWPSSRLLRPAFAILLILTPWWGPALSLTGTDYTYEATEIAVEDNRLEISDDETRIALRHGIDGFACTFGTSSSRYCTLEALTLNGSVEVDHPTITRSTGYLWADELYLAYSDGRVFERHSTWEDGHFVLSTERVSAAGALENVSSSTAPFPETETAIREGSVVTDERLWPRDAGAQVIKSDEEYYVVYQTFQRQRLSANPAFEEFLTWFAVVIGCAMLFGRDADQP